MKALGCRGKGVYLCPYSLSSMRSDKSWHVAQTKVSVVSAESKSERQRVIVDSLLFYVIAAVNSLNLKHRRHGGLTSDNMVQPTNMSSSSGAVGQNVTSEVVKGWLEWQWDIEMLQIMALMCSCTKRHTQLGFTETSHMSTGPKCGINMKWTMIVRKRKKIQMRLEI